MIFHYTNNKMFLTNLNKQGTFRIHDDIFK